MLTKETNQPKEKPKLALQRIRSLPQKIFPVKFSKEQYQMSRSVITLLLHVPVRKKFCSVLHV